MQQKEKVKRNQNYLDILFSKGGVFLSINYLAGMGILTYIAEKVMMHVHALKLHAVIVYFEHRFITLEQRHIEKKCFSGRSCQIRFDIKLYIISSSWHTYVHSTLTLLKSSLKQKFRFTPQTKDFNSTRETSLINGVTGSARVVSLKISVL